MTGKITKTLVVTAATAGLSLLGTVPASAGNGGWEPVGPGEPVTTKACGTTLTITEKVNRVESRTVEDGKGNTRTDYRGTYIVKVSTPDGRKVVLDNSGPYSVYDFADGSSFTRVHAPGLIYPFDDVERAAFKRAGLPSTFYYTKGRLDLSIDPDGNEKVVTKPRNPVSVCRLLH